MYTDTYRTPQKDPRTIPHREVHITEENEDYITEERGMCTDTYKTLQTDPRTIPQRKCRCIQTHIEPRRKTHELYHRGNEDVHRYI